MDNMDNMEQFSVWKRLAGRVGLRSAAVAIVLIALAFHAVAMRHVLAAPGTVTVTVTMGAFSPTAVKVDNSATSQLSATPGNLNPSPPTADEGSLVYTYTWSLQVLYKATINDPVSGKPLQYASTSSGSYTIKLVSPQQASTMLKFTPKKTGYWKISATCALNVTDKKNANLKWSGSGAAGPEDLTSAIVTFSPSPIITGASKSDPESIFVPVTATVSPKDLVQKINVSRFVTLSGGAGSAGGNNFQRDSSTGEIKFDVYGINGTAKSMPNGDVELEAEDGNVGDEAVLGSDLVVIEIPAAIGTPHPQVNPGVAVTPKNVDLSAGSVPSWQGVPAGDVLLGTLVETPISVPVVDQFGKPLSSLYNGQIVDEQSGGTFVPINVKIENGNYPDHVGFEADNGQQSLVVAGSPQAIAWPTSNQHDAIASPQSKTSSVEVQVAGFTLNPGVVNRTVSFNNGILTVTWP